MTVIPMNLPWEPDKGVMSQSSLDVCVNALPLPEGWGPISDLSEYSQALPGPCKGAWWFRSDAGVFNTVAATQTGLYKLSTAALSWTDITDNSTSWCRDGRQWRFCCRQRLDYRRGWRGHCHFGRPVRLHRCPDQ